MSFVGNREQRLIADLLLKRIGEDEFYQTFPIAVGTGSDAAHAMLVRALAERDPVAVEFGLYLGFYFGFSERYLDVLLTLADAPWHQCHESVVDALARLRAPESVDTLFRIALTSFPYRVWDDYDGLGTKCIYALASIKTPKALERLRELAEGTNLTLAREAGARLDKISADSDPEHKRAPANAMPEQQVRALFDDTTIRVYQAFSAEIADVAVATQKFGPPFSRGRMTWIKPSFTWMMYRSGWATQIGQERILAIDISRGAFEWALSHSAISHFDSSLHATVAEWQNTLKRFPVRIQWEPERSVSLKCLPWRTIQIGLGEGAVDAYVDEWIVRITDVTPLAYKISQLVFARKLAAATSCRPVEAPYPLSPELANRIGASV